MKKLLIVLLVVLMLATLLVAALPVSAGYQGYHGWPGAPCGAVGGDPPGWSQVSWGNGGSGAPCQSCP